MGNQFALAACLLWALNPCASEENCGLVPGRSLEARGALLAEMRLD